MQGNVTSFKGAIVDLIVVIVFDFTNWNESEMLWNQRQFFCYGFHYLEVKMLRNIYVVNLIVSIVVDFTSYNHFEVSA